MPRPPAQSPLDHMTLDELNLMYYPLGGGVGQDTAGNLVRGGYDPLAPTDEAVGVNPLQRPPELMPYVGVTKPSRSRNTTPRREAAAPTTTTSPATSPTTSPTPAGGATAAELREERRKEYERWLEGQGPYLYDTVWVNGRPRVISKRNPRFKKGPGLKRQRTDLVTDYDRGSDTPPTISRRGAGTISAPIDELLARKDELARAGRLSPEASETFDNMIRQELARQGVGQRFMDTDLHGPLPQHADTPPPGRPDYVPSRLELEWMRQGHGAGGASTGLPGPASRFVPEPGTMAERSMRAREAVRSSPLPARYPPGYEGPAPAPAQGAGAGAGGPTARRGVGGYLQEARVRHIQHILDESQRRIQGSGPTNLSDLNQLADGLTDANAVREQVLREQDLDAYRRIVDLTPWGPAGIRGGNP